MSRQQVRLRALATLLLPQSSNVLYNGVSASQLSRTLARCTSCPGCGSLTANSYATIALGYAVPYP